MKRISKIFKTKVFEWVKDGDAESLQGYIKEHLNSDIQNIKLLFQLRDHNNRSILHWASYLG